MTNFTFMWIARSSYTSRSSYASRVGSYTSQVPILARFLYIRFQYKPGVPIRLIVSYIGSPLYNLNKCIANILKAYVKDENSNSKNSTTFSNYIRNVPIEYDEIMVSFEVTSLYTNVPIIDTLNIMKEYVNDDKFFRKTAIPQDKFLELVHLVLSTNLWCCHGRPCIFNHSRNLYAGLWRHCYNYNTVPSKSLGKICWWCLFCT